MNEINRLFQRLCDADIDFVIVGGFAAILHGSSLLTRDLDVCAVLTRENVAKLREALRDLHPAYRLTAQKLSFLDNPDPDVDVRNLYLRTDLGPVDLLSEITGVGDFESVMQLRSKSSCSGAWSQADREIVDSGNYIIKI